MTGGSRVGDLSPGEDHAVMRDRRVLGGVGDRVGGAVAVCGRVRKGLIGTGGRDGGTCHRASWAFYGTPAFRHYERPRRTCDTRTAGGTSAQSRVRWLMRF